MREEPFNWQAIWRSTQGAPEQLRLPRERTSDTQTILIRRRATINNAVMRNPRSIIGQRKAWHNAITREINAGRLRPCNTPITIRLSACYPHHETPPDTDAISMATKLVTDALVANRIIPQDTPQYIAEIRLTRPQPYDIPGLIVELSHTP